MAPTLHCEPSLGEILLTPVALPLARADHRAAAAPPLEAAAQARMRRTNTNLFLWTLQGWLAMFYIGAGYAKVSEPFDSLVLLLGWPRSAGPELVRLLGLADIGLALGMLLPLVSWKVGRPVLVASGLLMAASQLGFLAYYLPEQRAWMVIINLALTGLTVTVLRLRWSWRQ